MSENNWTMNSDFIFCTNCGTQNEAGSLFCGNCGTKLLQPEQMELPAAEEAFPAEEAAPVFTPVEEPVFTPAEEPVFTPAAEVFAPAEEPEVTEMPVFVPAEEPAAEAMPVFTPAEEPAAELPVSTPADEPAAAMPVFTPAEETAVFAPAEEPAPVRKPMEFSFLKEAVTAEPEEEEVSPFALGLPDWDIVPPNVPVRRHKI